MNVSHIGRRLAVSGVATAVAAAGLVGATDVVANAVESSPTTYHCVTAVGPYDIPASVITDALPTSMKAGETQDGGAAVEIDFTVPAELAAYFPALGVTDLSSDDFGLAVGKAKALVENLQISSMAPNADGSISGSLAGTLAGYAAPAAGSYQVTMPDAFNLIAATTAGPASSPCTATGDLGALGSTNVTKNASTTTAKATKRSFRRGTVAKIRATVTDKVAFLDPTGKVKATRRGAKAVTARLNDKGVAVINLGKKLKPGKYTYTVSYGSGYYQTSKDKVVVKVVR